MVKSKKIVTTNPTKKGGKKQADKTPLGLIPVGSKKIVQEFEAIRPHIAQIVVLRRWGLSGEGVAASWVGRRIQPLQQRINYWFEYSRPEDPARITKEQMSDAELLDRLQHMFAQLIVLPTPQDEYHAKRPPPDHLGRNFMDLLPLPPPPPTGGAGPSAHSSAVPLPNRGEEEWDDSEATLTDYLLRWRQTTEGGAKRACSPSVDSEGTTTLQRRPRVAARKQRESLNKERLAQQHGNPEPTPSNPTAEATPNVENQSSTVAIGVLATRTEQASSTQQPMESYAPHLAQAREVWSMATEKAAEFDSIFKAMKTTQEVITRAKAFNEKLQALRMVVTPVLQFFNEDGDEAQTMVELVGRVPDRANAYAKSLAKDGILRALAAIQLAVPRIDFGTPRGVPGLRIFHRGARQS
ncbi:unnamed protein product [Miscanthus lutarioriparius]|uniref:Uncharacterized protein n=1 Tax=Miscanthus lutarioriparius TaxID=422564 RepID=A0A811Q5I2_9POAL|nr:unnamed protein product [Miscanthus lutarioriparius]